MNQYTYKLIISYDGNYFDGYSIQTNEFNTVQGVIQKALKHLLKSPIKIYSASRTDKFVHALNLTISFTTNLLLKPEVITRFINQNCNHINVKQCLLVNNNFNARYDVKSKTYLYVISYHKPNVFLANYLYYYPKIFDLKKLQPVINLLVGKKNFLSFSTSLLNNNIRIINWIKIIKKNNFTYIYINGNGFLKNMVRMIAGVLINFNDNKINLIQIKQWLDNPKKGSSGLKLPGYGLYLLKTHY